MPPAGIDRFNFVVADPSLEIVKGTIEVWDQHGISVPWDPAYTAVGVVKAEHTAYLDAPTTGQVPPDDLYQIGAVRIVLQVGPGEPYTQWTFDRALQVGNTSLWIGQVVVGFHATPRGKDLYEPFGFLEVVTTTGLHTIRSMKRGNHIKSP